MQKTISEKKKNTQKIVFLTVSLILDLYDYSFISWEWQKCDIFTWRKFLTKKKEDMIYTDGIGEALVLLEAEREVLIYCIMF